MRNNDNALYLADKPLNTGRRRIRCNNDGSKQGAKLWTI